VNWYPHHLKHGRFLKGLENAPDWNISRSRYWGTPMPIWKETTDTGLPGKQYRVIGSLDELKKWAVDPSKVENLTDIHREFLDDVQVWVDEAKTIKGRRVSEVFDCWIESGSMPFAALHYPFENKQKFEDNYPAQFVSEYIAQTRAWFYTMHVLSVGVFSKPSFENVLTTGTILAEDGSKMSKSKKNYPDPMLLINKYGVDSLRLYLMSSVVMKADNLNFSENEVSELRKKVFVIWWNLFAFYKTYSEAKVNAAGLNISEQPQKVNHVMDRWMLAHLQTVIKGVTTAFDSYDVVRGSRLLIELMNEISTWYLRQSRDRLKDDTANAAEAGQVFGHILVTLSQLFAPVAPFFSEFTYRELVNEKQSVHLSQWPQGNDASMDQKLIQDMSLARQIVEAAHGVRKEKGIKVRQPLAGVTVVSSQTEVQSDVVQVLLTEINVKKLDWHQQAGPVIDKVELDTDLTPELKAEGEARDVMRQIQQLRKEAGVNVNDLVKVQLPSWPETWTDQIKAKAKVLELKKGPEASILKDI
jgi:isoleucyl-tRNA synthetase